MPTGDVRETSINSAILSSNCSARGCEESGAIYFSMEDKYGAFKKKKRSRRPKLKQTLLAEQARPSNITSHIFNTRAFTREYIKLYDSLISPALVFALSFLSCSRSSCSIPVLSAFSSLFTQNIIILGVMNALRVDTGEVSKHEKKKRKKKEKKKALSSHAPSLLFSASSALALLPLLSAQ